MPPRARSLLSECYVHVINRSAHKVPLFERSKDYRDFLRILRDGLDRYPVRLVAYCLMSNYWHLVAAPVGSAVLSKLVHWVTTTHAVSIHKRPSARGHGPVHQGKFKSHPVQGLGQLLRVIRCVERQALAGNLVSRAEDWPWGSLADRQRSTPAVPLEGASFLSSRAWIDLVNASHVLDEAPLRHLSDDPGSGKGAQKRSRVGGRRGNHQAHAHVERPKHLRVIKLPGPLQPPEQRRNRPALSIK